MKRSRPLLLSAFSGVGGMDLGLEAAGFQHVGLIEKCSRCRKVISENRPSWRQLPWNDIHEAEMFCKPEFLGLAPGDLDLLAGAPPCQPYSTAGQWSKSGRLGLNDERANTLSAFLALARTFLPKVILMENVPSFWAKEFGAKNLVDKFFEELTRSVGVTYRVEATVLNAADFGVPQTRRRAIVVAWRTDESFSFPKGPYADEPLTAWDALHSITPEYKPECRGKWAGLLPSIPEGWNYLWHTDKGDGLNLFGYRTKFWSFLLKLARDKPAWTIAAQPGPSTGPFHWENRPLAVEELLALQTFPREWKVIGKYREQVKMIGNATPPLLAESLGVSIATQLLKLSSFKESAFLPRRTAPCSGQYTLPSVDRAYLHLVDMHPPHPGKGKGPNPRHLIETLK